MTKLSMDFAFCAAHHLPRSPGKCKRQHGHNYKLRITLAGVPDPETGMIMDFYDLGKIIEERIIEKLDHNDLNNIMDNPTAELISAWVWERLSPTLTNLYEVTLWEENGCFVSFQGEKAESI